MTLTVGRSLPGSLALYHSGLYDPTFGYGYTRLS